MKFLNYFDKIEHGFVNIVGNEILDNKKISDMIK